MVSTSEWRQAGSFFKHKGHNIFWREGGNPSGPVLLPVKLIATFQNESSRAGRYIVGGGPLSWWKDVTCKTLQDEPTGDAFLRSMVGGTWVKLKADLVVPRGK
jgi:hypothetical protein